MGWAGGNSALEIGGSAKLLFTQCFDDHALTDHALTIMV
jgi:hypothetical protein